MPLFDCVYCVKNSSDVVKGVLKHSLRRHYYESFLEQSNNNQIPIPLGPRVLSKYDADAIQAYFDEAHTEPEYTDKAKYDKQEELTSHLFASFKLKLMLL